MCIKLIRNFKIVCRNDVNTSVICVNIVFLIGFNPRAMHPCPNVEMDLNYKNCNTFKNYVYICVEISCLSLVLVLCCKVYFTSFLPLLLAFCCHTA